LVRLSVSTCPVRKFGAARVANTALGPSISMQRRPQLPKLLKMRPLAAGPPAGARARLDLC